MTFSGLFFTSWFGRSSLPSRTFLLTIAALATVSSASGALPLTTIAWGNNSYGETDIPSDLTNAVLVDASSGFNVALLNNGTVRSWGGNGYAPPAGLTGVRSVSYRQSLGLVLFSNGTVTAWGANYYGGTNVPVGLSQVVAVSAGDYHGLALKNDGTVVGWGGQDGSGVVPLGLNGVAAISAGQSHSLALRSNGIVVAWGWNYNGMATAPPGLSNVIAIEAGGYHSMALKNDGTVIVWGGQDTSVQPQPGLSNVTAISAGQFHNLALRSDGAVVAWGYNSRGQTDVPAGLKEVVAISAGNQHSAVLSGSSQPLIQTQPQSATAYVGGNVQLSVGAIGPSLFYQWRKDGIILSSATHSTLTLSNLSFTNAGAYSVIVSNFAGSITSAPASLTVVEPPTPPDFNVTSPSQYDINGLGQNPTLTLMRGKTYTFGINASPAHPFEIVSNPGGTPYNEGVSNNNISSGTITFTVPATAPNTLFYICSFHYFGGTINIVDPPVFRIVSIALTTNSVVLRSLGSNGWMSVPEFSSNLISSNWAIVPSYSNALVNGTNVTVFNRLEPICGPNVFLRVKSTMN